jgi:hypothetical protein
MAYLDRVSEASAEYIVEGWDIESAYSLQYRVRVIGPLRAWKIAARLNTDRYAARVWRGDHLVSTHGWPRGTRHPSQPSFDEIQRRPWEISPPPQILNDYPPEPPADAGRLTRAAYEIRISS